jgi:hypothetical protein
VIRSERSKDRRRRTGESARTYRMTHAASLSRGPAARPRQFLTHSTKLAPEAHRPEKNRERSGGLPPPRRFSVRSADASGSSPSRISPPCRVRESILTQSSTRIMRELKGCPFGCTVCVARKRESEADERDRTAARAGGKEPSITIRGEPVQWGRSFLGTPAVSSYSPQYAS